VNSVGRGPDEFDLIAKYFAPLARKAPGAFNLTDDVAHLPSSQTGLVASVDSIVQGVHFLPDDPLALVARKLMRRNVSDLVAKGVKPVGYMLALCWPASAPVEDIGDFAEGLAEDQAAFDLHLYGGDTTRTDGPLTATITIFGESLGRGPVLRRGAAAGDSLFVTGTIGDGGLGLLAAQGRIAGLSDSDKRWLIGRYQLPQPRAALSRMIAEHATAAIDISDGLAADAGHLAKASGFRLEIDAAAIPLSDPAQRWLQTQSDQAAGLRRLFSAGDDYEVLFCAAPRSEQTVIDMAARAGVAVARIGAVSPGRDVGIKGPDGKPMGLAIAGWAHF
jgi:thiamine-monophosphate kinase